MNHVRERGCDVFGELEAVIMDRLWEWGAGRCWCARWSTLCMTTGALAYTTVMTVMDNLYRKGLAAAGSGDGPGLAL